MFKTFYYKQHGEKTKKTKNGCLKQKNTIYQFITYKYQLGQALLYFVVKIGVRNMKLAQKDTLNPEIATEHFMIQKLLKSKIKTKMLRVITKFYFYFDFARYSRADIFAY